MPASPPLLSNLTALPAAEGFARVPREYARRHGVVAVVFEGRTHVVVADLAESFDAADFVARKLPGAVTFAEAPAPEIEAALDRLERDTDTKGVAAAAENLSAGTADRLAELKELAGRQDLLDAAGRAPVIRLVNLLLAEAIAARASDVHLQPEEEALLARLRIDGTLHTIARLPRASQDEVVSRVKVMARMDIAEKRLPQDGRVAVEVGSRQVDLRVSTLPTDLGERVVIRLLDRSRGLLSLPQLAMPPKVEQTFRGLIGVEHGILLVTGPTGSGKTTTLYAALGEIDHDRRNVLTIEDPIEYRLPGVSQTQIGRRKGMTFAAGLRSILRQDPDVIMVGEVRDGETAQVAVQAALTGHLVLSTLHTNDAAGAVVRLVELGVEPFLLASSLVGVLAQRLVRRVCPQCAAPAKGGPAGLLEGGGTPMVGRGCDYCRGTGYLGRLGVHELMPMTPELLDLIRTGGDADALRRLARRGGMTTLREAAAGRLAAGETTVEEVLRLQG